MFFPWFKTQFAGPAPSLIEIGSALASFSQLLSTQFSSLFCDKPMGCEEHQTLHLFVMLLMFLEGIYATSNGGNPCSQTTSDL